MLHYHDAMSFLPSTYSHVVFTPQGYHVGTMESFSFSSYSQEVFDVTAKVTYNQCTCSNGRRSCSDTGSSFDEARERARQGRCSDAFSLNDLAICTCSMVGVDLSLMIMPLPQVLLLFWMSRYVSAYFLCNCMHGYTFHMLVIRQSSFGGGTQSK